MPGDDATSAISEHDRRLFAFNRDAEERIDRDLRAATPAQPFTSCRIAALATMKMVSIVGRPRPGSAPYRVTSSRCSTRSRASKRA